MLLLKMLRIFSLARPSPFFSSEIGLLELLFFFLHILFGKGASFWLLKIPRKEIDAACPAGLGFVARAILLATTTIIIYSQLSTNAHTR